MINYEEIMKNFACWCFKAKYSPNGEVFDWGGTTEYAIKNFKNGCEPLLCGGNKFSDNGNGSLMRILPIAYFIYLFSLKYSFSEEDKMKVIHNLSSLTHRHGISQMACGTYVLIAIELLKNRFVKENGLSLEEMVKNGIRMAKEYYYKNDYFQEFLPDFDVIFNEDIKNKSIDIIRGRGYVISSLEASLWCLLNNNSYKETALAAVNLGEDTDTTAAIACGLAGIYYGYENIPTNWLDQIVRFDFIEELIGNFSDYLSNI